MNVLGPPARIVPMISREHRDGVGSALPGFSGLPAPTRERILSSPRFVSVPDGSAVFEDGDACQSFPLVVAGSVRVAKLSPGGRELLLYRIFPGEFCLLSSACLLGNSTYPARGIAGEHTQLIVLP